jgi:2-iminobutanoate/2-iminopropanoate deaminase
MQQLVQYRNPDGVHPPNREYSHAAVLTDPAARLCFVSGQVGVGPGGTIDPSLGGQIDTVFTNLGAVLADVGSSFGDVMQLTTYLVDEADIEPYTARRAELFADLFADGYPPNTLVVVHALARPALRVEVQAIAAIPPKGSR